MTLTMQALLLVAAAWLLTAALAPLTLTLLRHWQVVDHPNHRSSHQAPTLRGGGLAVLGGILLAAALGHLLGAAPVPWTALATVLALAAVGLAADTTDIGPVARFLAQAFAGAALGSLVGDHRTALLGALAMPVLVNAVNFMDGINGITGLTAAAWAVVVLVGAGTQAAVVLAALTLGGALGFLPWNLPRARMFLGDSGSYLFGALVAAALLHEQAEGGRPLLVLAPMVLYLADTGLTLVRRAARGERLSQAHREHLYQRLSRRPGWGHAPVAALWAGMALVSGAVAVLLVGQNGAL